MIAFLKELRLAEHTYVDLRRDLIWIRRLMLAIPTTDRLDVTHEVSKELLSGHGDVPTECVWIVRSAEKHEVIELQERFESFIAEQVEAVFENRVKKFVGCDHVPANAITKIVAAAIQHRIDSREVALHIVQFIINAPEI